MDLLCQFLFRRFLINNWTDILFQCAQQHICKVPRGKNPSRPPYRPKWSSISDWPLSLLHGFSFFSFLLLLLGCGFDNDLIIVGLWVVACGGCGLWVRCWVVGSDSVGSGVGGNASWVSNFFFFFCFLIVGFIWFWLASGLKNERDFWSRFKGFNWFWMCNWKFWNIFTNVVFLYSWGKDSMVRVFDPCYVWFLIKLCFSNIWGWVR